MLFDLVTLGVTRSHVKFVQFGSEGTFGRDIVRIDKQDERELCKPRSILLSGMKI